MPTERPTNEPWLEIDVPAASAPLRVMRIWGEEALSAPFHFSLQVESDVDNLNSEAIVGGNASITIYSQSHERAIKGIVSRFEFCGVERHVGIYNVDIVPSLYVLGQQVQSRIFQEKSVIDILTEVLNTGGVESSAYRFNTIGPYDPLEYCVQYRESNLDFFNRLTEAAGLFYFFDYSDDETVLVIGDSLDACPDAADGGSVLYRATGGNIEYDDFLQELKLSQALVSNKHTMRDFNFKTPMVDLTKNESTNGSPVMEHYDYPAEVKTTVESARVAKLRSEAEICDRSSGSGLSNSVRLVPGFIFGVTNHPVGVMNARFLVTRIVHTASQPVPGTDEYGHASYNNEFQMQPGEQVYRSPLRTRRPVIAGSQTAIVTGPEGEEIFTDEYGRIKVRFHWDRNPSPVDKTSCWIRVAQKWAGNSWGGIAIPRIGQEVIVDFIEGNPNRPIVTGCVYNAVNMPPYDLPGDQTKSTIKSESSIGGDGFNEVRFEDLKGSEEIYVHAQKDLNLETLNDRSESIGHDETHSVKKNRTRSVGADESISVEGNRSISVMKNLSTSVTKDETRSVDQGRSTNISKNDQLDVGEDCTISIGKNYNESIQKESQINVGENLKVSVGKSYGCDVEQSILLNAGKDITLKCGGASIVLKKNGDIQIKGKNISLKGSGDVIIKGSKISQN